MQGGEGERHGGQACSCLCAGHRPGHHLGQGCLVGGGRAGAGGGRELLQGDTSTRQQPGSWTTGKGRQVAQLKISGYWPCLVMAGLCSGVTQTSVVFLAYSDGGGCCMCLDV